MTVESITAEIRSLQDEANQLTSKKVGFTSADSKRVDFILARVSELRGQLKSAQTTDEQRTQRARALMLQTHGPDALLSKEEKASIRTLLLAGRGEERTYTPMSVATDGQGGDFVPQSFYDRLTFALKRTDALFDDDVITVVPTEHGNAMTLPFADDTGAAASIVTENSNGTETEIATIDRLSFGKTPTWRSGKLFATVEILQDSAFDVEGTVIVPAVTKRFQRGVGAANVTTLLSSITSGATSAVGGTISWGDCISLLGSVNPEFLSGPKSFWAMNFSTLIALMELTDSNGRPIWYPQYDPSNRPLLFGLPVVVSPSLPNVASGAKSVVLGDFSRCIRRQVQNVRVVRYEQAPNFIENGIVGYQAFLRSDFGVLTSTSSDAPMKYLTVR